MMFIGSGVAMGEVGAAVGKMIPSMLALKLGPEDDPDSIYMMKVIIGTPIPFALMSIFIFIFIYPQRTPRYCMSIGN